MMTGREKINAAFAPAGTPEIGVVTAYDSIFIRDHWFSLTACPWWLAFSGIPGTEVWARDYAAKSGLDWLAAQPCLSRAERARQRYEQRADGMWRIDAGTGRETRLLPPTPGGTNTACAASHHPPLPAAPSSAAEVDRLLPVPGPFERRAFLEEGRADVAMALRASLDVFLYGHLTSPLWSLYNVMGYEFLMELLALDPDLALYAGRRALAGAVERIKLLAALGVDAVWIEECLTDQVHPDLFRRVNLPLVRHCVETLHAHGLRSIYYYCGNPHDRLGAILDAGADAVHFEESKKGFSIDIVDILRTIGGRCVVFGNLDAVGCLRDGTDDQLRQEIGRQLDAARSAGSRFVMSTGSPITPDTPTERVRRYADLVHACA